LLVKDVIQNTKRSWCEIILNVRASTEDKTDDNYEELERVFDKFPKYHTKLLLRNFNVKPLGMRVYTKLVVIMELEY
jgi:hypothetical protein